ncbi:ABC transporter substrate-binding protein [Dactylosporangium sp. NPDC000521]|uniref:ABC transporter substrate-binding protein n=1 Tax=Dactylosporangium sp. NPDC000521 TaxID=3363975 RepID=UPI0036BD8943
MSPPSQPAVGRRAFLGTLLGSAAALGLGACAGDPAGDALAAAAPVPTEVDRATALTISIRRTRIQLEGAGLIDQLPFTVKEWANLEAGPDVIQGFRARSVDLANNAGVPPIQARAINYDAKIVAVQTVPKPIYKFATVPGANINALSDLRGKKIAFSQGQAQGVVVLRTLKELGLSTKDVQLIALTSNQFYTALQSKQVDAAILAEPSLTKYLDQYGKDGAKGLDMNAVDYLSVLWAPTEVLQDKAKAAAIRGFIPFWVKGNIWAWEQQDAWIDRYYVADQKVTKADGQRILAATPRPVFPTSWDRAIAWEQETADLLAAGGFVPQVKAADLFDRRFEPVASEAAGAKYQAEA